MPKRCFGQKREGLVRNPRSAQSDPRQFQTRQPLNSPVGDPVARELQDFEIRHPADRIKAGLSDLCVA